MKRTRITIWCLCLAVPLVLAQNLSYQQDPNWRAPEEAMHRKNPLAARPELAAGGRKLFLRNCAECHGANGHGSWRATIFLIRPGDLADPRTLAGKDEKKK